MKDNYPETSKNKKITLLKVRKIVLLLKLTRNF